MKIGNINGYSAADLQKEAANGARFVDYSFCISVIVTTFKKTSRVYMIRPGESAARKGFGYTLLSLLFGWWAIPRGPRHTLKSIRKNMKGGNDVTDEVTATIDGHLMFHEVQQSKKLLIASAKPD
jgi:hypothetical protein